MELVPTRPIVRVLILSVSLMTLCGSTSADSMEEYVKQASDHARWADGRIRERISEFSSRKIREVLDRTEFVVDNRTSIPTAYAERLSHGRQRIVMSAQLVLVFYYIAELNLYNLSTENRWESCALAYSSYLRIFYAKMMEDVLAGRDTSHLQPPEEYARDYRGRCVGLEKNYPFPESLRVARFNSVSAAIATVYLHELAHHVYRDVNELTGPLDLSNPESMRLYLRLMCHSQQKELRADKWAARTLVEIGWGSNVFDMTIWGALTGLGDIDPDIERGGSHPSPSRRMGVFLDSGRTYLRAMGVSIRSDLSDVIDQAILLQNKIELLLPLTPIPGTESIDCH